MASFLPLECLEIIFLNFIKHPPIIGTRINLFTKELYSCTLVSRHWCRISIPFLYAYPFHNLDTSIDSMPLYFKLIRTLLSCIPQFEIKQFYTPYEQVLSTNNIPFNNKKSIFNYFSFMIGFVFDEIILISKNVCRYKNIWLSAYNPEKLSSKQTIKILKYFVKF